MKDEGLSQVVAAGVYYCVEVVIHKSLHAGNGKFYIVEGGNVRVGEQEMMDYLDRMPLSVEAAILGFATHLLKWAYVFESGFDARVVKIEVGRTTITEVK